MAPTNDLSVGAPPIETLKVSSTDPLVEATPVQCKEVDSSSDVDSIIEVESIAEVESISELESIDEGLESVDEGLESEAVKSTVSDDGYCSPVDQEFIVGSIGISANIEESTTQSTFCSENWEIRHDGSEERSFQILDVPGKGKGMFALKKIYPGEIILREVPLVITADEIFNDYEKCEKFLDKAVDKMSMQQRKRFLSLSDGRSLDDPTYVGRLYTNDMDWDGDVCLCPTMARANHSCRPNADFYSRVDLGEMRLVATNIIQQGSEITICYLPSSGEASDKRKVRQDSLLNFWGFLCTCKECTLKDEDLDLNDALREEIKELQSCGLEKLTLDELHHLSLLCLEVGVKPSYNLDILEAMYDRSQTQVDKYIQSIRGLGVSMHTYGEDSKMAAKWRQRLELDDYSTLQF